MHENLLNNAGMSVNLQFIKAIGESTNLLSMSAWTSGYTATLLHSSTYKGLPRENTRGNVCGVLH